MAEVSKIARNRPVKPNFDLPWERAWEHVYQLDSSYLSDMREARGWSRMDVCELSDEELPVPQQELYEEFPGLPRTEDLAEYARLFGVTPGEFLDAILRITAEELDTAATGGITTRDGFEYRAVGTRDGGWCVQHRQVGEASWTTLPRRFETADQARRYHVEEPQ